MTGKRNKVGGKYRQQKANKIFDKKKIKNIPTGYTNFNTKEIEDRRLLIEKHKKQNKLIIEEEE